MLGKLHLSVKSHLLASATTTQPVDILWWWGHAAARIVRPSAQSEIADAAFRRSNSLCIANQLQWPVSCSNNAVSMLTVWLPDVLATSLTYWSVFCSARGLCGTFHMILLSMLRRIVGNWHTANHCGKHRRAHDSWMDNNVRELDATKLVECVILTNVHRQVN